MTTINLDSMPPDILYECFDKFIFRCPLFPINTNKDGIYDSLLFKESIFLASPELYRSVYDTSRELSPKDMAKQKSALLKYAIRISSRCTPFGLFAGCGIGSLGGKTKIIVGQTNMHRTSTRLDMNYLCALAQQLSALDKETKSLLYFPNTSLYQLGDCYRYVEYRFSNGRRKHYLTEVDWNPYLETVLSIVRNGSDRASLISGIIADDITYTEAEDFIDDLIQTQILVSELDPGVTGPDTLDQFIHKLKNFKEAAEVRETLTYIKDRLNELDGSGIGREVTRYLDIEEKIKQLNVPYERKFLFQSDLFINATEASLDKTVIESVKTGLSVLNKLTPFVPNKPLSDFIENFYNRYEDEEVPLCEALDSDIGIGFNHLTQGKSEICPLIDSIPILNPGYTEPGPPNPIDLLLYRKLIESKTMGSPEIVIEEEDLTGLKEDWTDLPMTFCSAIEIIDRGMDSPPLIFMNAAGNASGANLLSRFSHIDGNISAYVSEIIKKESSLCDENKILAEIVHLPEARTGNILLRPALRKYEIPYLAPPSVTSEFSLPINDLLISLTGNKTIRLRSGKLNKEILPRLTSAHSFRINSLPIYHFLCVLQAQKERAALTFQWGEMVKKENSLPRVRYRNIIFSPCTWFFNPHNKQDQIPLTLQNFTRDLHQFIIKHKVPEMVFMKDGDNKLLLDLNNDEHIHLLFSQAKSQTLVLEEYLHSQGHSLIQDEENAYNNQIILSFYKKKDPHATL